MSAIGIFALTSLSSPALADQQNFNSACSKQPNMTAKMCTCQYSLLKQRTNDKEMEYLTLLLIKGTKTLQNQLINDIGQMRITEVLSDGLWALIACNKSG